MVIVPMSSGTVISLRIALVAAKEQSFSFFVSLHSNLYTCVPDNGVSSYP